MRNWKWKEKRNLGLYLVKSFISFIGLVFRMFMVTVKAIYILIWEKGTYQLGFCFSKGSDDNGI